MATLSSIIPIYTSRGDAAAFLQYPYLYNNQGEWIGWITQERDIYSVLGYYVGYLTNEPRILRKRAVDDIKPRLDPPPHPPHLAPPATVPLAPLMKEIYQDTLDVLLDEPERLHTQDLGELRQDLE